MANLVIPRRGIRTEQPTEMVGIAPYWLAKNPALLCNYGVSHLNLIDGSGSYKSAAATVGVTQHGAGRYSLASSGFNYPDMPFGGNAPISIVAFVAGYSSVGSGVVGQGTEIVLRTNAANNGCEFLLNSFATNDRVSVVATPRPGGGLLLAGTYGPSGKLRAYANGAMAEVAPTGTYANIASVFDVISTAVGTYGSNVHAVAIFRSELSQADVLSLVANPWQIFAPRETRLFVPVSAGGTTTVTNSSAASYKIQGSVQSSSVASYGIRSAVQSDSEASYAIRESAQNDAASTYSIRGSIQQSSTLAYAIRGLVDQAVAVNYSIRSAVSSDASATYNILSATSVSASTSAGYSIRGSINQGTTASYSLRGSVTKDTSATYSILSASSVSASITAGYAIKGSVQSSIVAGYSIAQAVQAEIAASYIIRAGAVSEAQAAYVIRGLVQQSIAASYAIDGGTFSGAISDADIARIVQAVLAALNATTIPVDMKKTNGITIIGTGSKLSPWRPA